MEKSINKWLVISFMLGVCIFCFAYLGKVSADSSDGTTAVAETPQTPVEDDIITPTPTPTPVFYNELPKLAQANDSATVQNVGGTENDVLQSVHTISNVTYLFFDTSSNGYDVSAERACVAVATLDDNATLLRVMALCGTAEEKFESVKLVADGFVLVTSSATYNCVYKINFDLIVTAKLTLEPSNGARLYLQNNRLYLMLQKADKLQIKVLSQDLDVLQTCSTALSNAEIVEVFPLSDCINIFVNGTDYYGLLRYTDSGFISVNVINGYNLLTVMPYVSDGTQGFVGLKKSSEVCLFTTDNLFNETAVKGLGEAQYATLFAINDNFSVYLSYADSTAKLAIYCKHLDNILTNPVAIAFDSIGYRDYSSSEVTLTAYGGNKMFVLTFDGLTFKTQAEYFASRGYSYITYDNTLCFSSTIINAYGKNYGNADVYLIKTA